MEDPQKPSLRDIASLLQVANGGGHVSGTADTVLWLIEQSEEARQLYNQLTAKRGEEPSLKELARLECAVTSEQSIPEALETGRWLIAKSETATAHLESLEQLLADAGEKYQFREWIPLLDLDQELNHLADARDDWQSPGDVLDPTRDFGVSVRTLYSLCLARIERGAGASHRLKSVQKKLERALEIEGMLPLSQARFDRLGEWLAELESSEEATESLEEMACLLTSALESSEHE